MTSIFGMLGVDLTAPDHTTLSRRGQHLALALRRARPGTSLHLIVDSTGLSIVGEGEWAAAKHGGRGRRGWRKLHLGVDGSRVIVACALTEPTADDAITGISLVDEVDGHLTRVTADPAYDTRAFYGAAGARGARVVVPPTKTASLLCLHQLAAVVDYSEHVTILHTDPDDITGYTVNPYAPLAVRRDCQPRRCWEERHPLLAHVHNLTISERRDQKAARLGVIT